MTFTVACNSFKDGDYLPSDFILSSDFGFGCAGRNRSPHLKWSGAPEGTKSFPVTCYDPHAPISVCLATAGPVHPRATIPHRYLFTVFAVKTDKLDLKADTSAAVVGFNLHFNTLAKAEIMGLFKG